MTPKLFMTLLGCRPKGRLTEQHDVFFGIADSLAGLVPQIKAFWPGCTIHIDSWREVTVVAGYAIEVTDNPCAGDEQLYFINLGGYKPDDPEEYHYKLLAVAPTMADAVKQAKQTAFYKHVGFDGAPSHVDDKFGIDADDVYRVDEILSDRRWFLNITPAENAVADVLHIGYLPLSKIG